DLQQKIDVSLASLFEKEKDFVPHLTLGRIKLITNKKQFHSIVEKIAVKPLRFSVDEFQLLESKLSKLGPMHKIIKKYSAVD
ncbi:MAG: 2'-5' RNA ligase family protein, partial [Candidatus Woesearchaeota archaeon]|nr:2'-5' RNA ligase family protein [Candidatus Woesearchaeota archaeon]